MVISGPSNRERRIVKRILMITLLLGLMSPAACGSLWPGQETPANEIKLAGHIEATETDLAFQVPGRIEAISVDAGEEVKAGQVVAKLDDKVLRHEVDAAEGAWSSRDATPAHDAARRRTPPGQGGFGISPAAPELCHLDLPGRRPGPGTVSQSRRISRGGHHHHYPGRSWTTSGLRDICRNGTWGR